MYSQIANLNEKDYWKEQQIVINDVIITNLIRYKLFTFNITWPYEMGCCWLLTLVVKLAVLFMCWLIIIIKDVRVARMFPYQVLFH